MKKVATIFGAILFASIILTSCSQRPEDIRLSDLKTACDYVDALESVLDGMSKTIGDIKAEELHRYKSSKESMGEKEFKEWIEFLQDEEDGFGFSDEELAYDFFNRSEDLSEEENEYLSLLEEKFREIDDAGDKKYTDTEFKECSNFKRAKEKGSLLNRVGSIASAYIFNT